MHRRDCSTCRYTRTCTCVRAALLRWGELQKIVPDWEKMTAAIEADPEAVKVLGAPSFTLLLLSYRSLLVHVLE